MDVDLKYLTEDNAKVGLKVKEIHNGRIGEIVSIKRRGVVEVLYNNGYCQDDLYIIWLDKPYFEIVEDLIKNKNLKCSSCNIPAPHLELEKYICDVCKVLSDIS